MTGLYHLILLRCGEATFKIYLITYPILLINNLSRIELIASVRIISQLLVTLKRPLNDLKSGKCAGIDNIQAEHLNNASNVLNVLLSILCTAMMKHGYIVNTILETVIISVIKNKSGDATDRHNYRPIAIRTTMSKVLELLALHKMYYYLYTTDNQYLVLNKTMVLIYV